MIASNEQLFAVMGPNLGVWNVEYRSVRDGRPFVSWRQKKEISSLESTKFSDQPWTMQSERLCFFHALIPFMQRRVIHCFLTIATESF